ncbi:MAG: oligosaccharide flippase family protein [Bacteroidales bacterium]|nr:oligosaccharide flippase family protein [Bacteroidales bacterium]
MLKKFTENLIFLLFLNLLIKPFWIFGIDRSIQNIVGAEQYGFYISLFNFSLIFNILTDFGLNNYNTKNIAQNRQLLNKHLSKLISLKVILSLLYALVSILFAYLIGYSDAQIKFLGILIVNQILASFFLYLRSNLAALHLFKANSILSVSDKLLMIIFCGFLILKHPLDFNIKWLAYSQTMAYTISAAVAFIIVLKKSGRLRINYDYRFLMAIMKQSLPFALLILLMTVYTRIDFVMLERMLPNGNYYSGIYAQAFRIVDALNVFAYLFATLLLPIFSKMIKDQSDLENMLKKSALILLAPVLILIVSVLFYSQDIMQVLYKEHAENSAKILTILMPGFGGIAAIYIYGTLLTANGNLKHLNRISAIGVGLNILLNYIFIPKYQYIGAAYSSMATQILMASLQFYFVYKIFHFTIFKNEVFKFLLFLLIIILQTKLMYEITGYRFILFLVNTAVSFLWIFILKIIDIKELRKFIALFYPVK